VNAIMPTSDSTPPINFPVITMVPPFIAMRDIVMTLLEQEYNE
jgi:hypothetical protein